MEQYQIGMFIAFALGVIGGIMAVKFRAFRKYIKSKESLK